ncbi:MAG: GNAT family N-acetyltransferase [Desulfatibacillaceae bacterium]
MAATRASVERRIEGRCRIVDLDRRDETQVADYYGIYRGIFTSAEREPEGVVHARHVKGRYKTRLALDGGEVVGFATINPVPKIGYTSLNFLGVAESHRRHGIGEALLFDVLDDFRQGRPEIRYLIIEAEEAPSRFYQARGIRRIKVPYRVPHFGDAKALDPLDLLIYAEKIPRFLSRKELNPIVHHLLTYGYGLDEDDPRIARCFDWGVFSAPVA